MTGPLGALALVAVFGGQHASFYVQHTDDDGVRKSSGGVRIDDSKIRIKERPCFG